MSIRKGRLTSQGLTAAPVNFPSGTVIPFAGENVPTGWALCDGSVISREDFAGLYAAIGDAWGNGDGSTTFHLPDLRGRFLRGTDNSAGRDPNSITRTSSNSGGNSGDAVGSVQSHDFSQHDHGGGSHQHYTPYFSDNGFPDGAADRTNSYYLMHPARGTDYRWLSNTPNQTVINNEGGAENRPINANVNYIIKL